MNILIFIYILVYAILAKLRLDWAVMILIAVLPTYLIRFNIFGVPFTLLEAMILTAFLIWFLFYTEFKNFLKGRYGIKQFLENRKKRLDYPFGLEIILLLIVSFISVAISGFSDSSLGIFKAYFFEPALFYILILNVFKPNANSFRIKRILWPLAISAFIISIIAIYQKFTGAWIMNDLWAANDTRRVVSFFGYPNAVGLFLGPIIMALIGWITYKIFNFKFLISKKIYFYKIFFIGLVIFLSVLSIYFAKSEGALIGVFAGLIIFLLFFGKKIRLTAIIFILAVVISIYAFPLLRDYTFKKITLNDLSGEIRKQQWKETWDMLKDGRIIAGAGLANYQNAINPYHQEGIFFNSDNDPEFYRHVVWNDEYKIKAWQPTEIYLYPHNIFFNFWCELGLAGMLLFIWIIGKYFFVGIKLIKDLKLSAKNYNFTEGGRIEDLNYNIFRYLILGLICSMIVIVVHGFVDVPYFKNDLAVIFWLLIAMMSLIKLKVKN